MQWDSADYAEDPQGHLAMLDYGASSMRVLADAPTRADNAAARLTPVTGRSGQCADVTDAATATIASACARGCRWPMAVHAAERPASGGTDTKRMRPRAGNNEPSMTAAVRAIRSTAHSPDRYVAMASRSLSLSARMKPGMSRLLLRGPLAKLFMAANR